MGMTTKNKSIVALDCLFWPNLISVQNWIKEVYLAETCKARSAIRR